MKKSILLLFAFSCLFLVGCASTQQFARFPDQTKKIEDPTKARIYVLRPALVGSAISMDVSDNGQLVGSTGPHGFLCWERQPGTTVVSSKAENRSTVELVTQPGQVYYIFQHMRMGWVYARSHLEIVDEAEGLKELKSCKPPQRNSTFAIQDQK